MPVFFVILAICVLVWFVMISKMFKKNLKVVVPSTDFSKFFVLAKADEKKKTLKEVVEKANEDQKRLYQSHR